MGVIGELWWSGGSLFFHSKDGDRCDVEITPRWQIKASHSMKMNRRRATKDIVDPNVDTTFHDVNASG